MTTLSASATKAPARPTSRILAVTRLHFVNKFVLVYQPLIILGSIFVVNLAIWLIIVGAAEPADRAKIESNLGNSGAVFYIFVYALIIAVQAVSRTFPFALGFGVTRRNFYLGSSLAFVVLAALFSAVLTVMSAIEIATGGWGIGGHMFAPDYFTNDFWLIRFVMDFLLFLFCLFVGSAAASVWVRWRVTGIIIFFAILAVIIVGGVALLTLNRLWPAFAAWIVANGSLGVSLWLLVPTAVCALAGYLILRRATLRG